MSLASFLASVTSIFESAMSMMGQVTSAIGDSAILTTFVGISLAGVGIGFFKRLLSVN